MVLAEILKQRQWVDNEGYQYARRQRVEVPRAVAEYYDMRIIEDDEDGSESNTEETSEDEVPVAEEDKDEDDDWVCGYEGTSGTCSRSVDDPDEYCWQHS